MAHTLREAIPVGTLAVLLAGCRSVQSVGVPGTGSGELVNVELCAGLQQIVWERDLCVAGEPVRAGADGKPDPKRGFRECSAEFYDDRAWKRITELSFAFPSLAAVHRTNETS